MLRPTNQLIRLDSTFVTATQRHMNKETRLNITESSRADPIRFLHLRELIFAGCKRSSSAKKTSNTGITCANRPAVVASIVMGGAYRPALTLAAEPRHYRRRITRRGRVRMLFLDTRTTKESAS